MTTALSTKKRDLWTWQARIHWVKRQVIVFWCSGWADEWQWSVKAIKRAKRGMVCICSRSSDQALWCPLSCKTVTTREAGDVLQEALYHFAACSVFLHAQKLSDVRSNEYGSDNIRSMLTLKRAFQAEMKNLTQTNAVTWQYTPQVIKLVKKWCLQNI